MKTIRGVDPNDFTFPDLLKLLTSNTQSVRAVVRRGDEVARVVIHKQNIVHAEYGDAVGEKALYRLFGWRDASYEIEALQPSRREFLDRFRYRSTRSSWREWSMRSSSAGSSPRYLL